MTVNKRELSLESLVLFSDGYLDSTYIVDSDRKKPSLLLQLTSHLHVHAGGQIKVVFQIHLHIHNIYISTNVSDSSNCAEVINTKQDGKVRMVEK